MSIIQQRTCISLPLVENTPLASRSRAKFKILKKKLDSVKVNQTAYSQLVHDSQRSHYELRLPDE